MFRQLRLPLFAALLAVLIGASFAGTGYLLDRTDGLTNQLGVEQHRNDVFHSLTAKDLLQGAEARARLGALLDHIEGENRDSIRDRKQIAELLGRLEGSMAEVQAKAERGRP